MRSLLITLPVLAIIMLFVRAISQSFVKSQCTASTEGKLTDVDSSAKATGGSLGSAIYTAIYFPIYEYVVDGMAYWAQLDTPRPNPVAFEKNVKVLYNPSKPEICYIDGQRGKIVSTYDKVEYDKNSNGLNRTSDYKWRP